MDQQTQSILVPIIAVIVVLALRARRMSREQPLKLETLWVVPALYTLFAGVMLWSAPPALAEAPWLVVALALGGLAGWWRGRAMRITVDPATHTLNQQGSPAALFFLVGIVAVRTLAKTLLDGRSGALHLSAMFVTDLFVLFAVGLFAMTRLEMFLRGRRLLTGPIANRHPGESRDPARRVERDPGFRRDDGV